MKWLMPLGFSAGMLLGALGALAASAWRRPAAATFCVRCAMHREGGRERQGAVYTLLARTEGAHAHRWAEPDHGRRLTPEARAMSDEAVRDEVDELDALERDPEALALVVEASRNDPRRTASLLHAILDPGAHVPVTVLRLLDRPQWPWSDRARLIDGFLDQYRCERAPTSVVCTLPVGAVTAVAWHRVPGSLLRGTIPWNTWSPPGFALSPAPVAAVAPPLGQGPVMMPIPPLPSAPPTPGASARPGAPRLPPPLGSPPRPRVVVTPGQREASRARALAQIDDMILAGRCSAAQALFRQMRASGAAPDGARDHFGSACPLP